MNALAHATEALYGPGRNPVAGMAAAAAAGDIAAGARGCGGGRPRAAGAGLDPRRLRPGLGRLLAPPRALPDDRARVRDAARRHQRGDAPARRWRRCGSRAEMPIAGLADALGVSVDGLPGRVVALGGGPRLARRAGRRRPATLGAVADAALERPELARLRPAARSGPSCCACSERRSVGCTRMGKGYADGPGGRGALAAQERGDHLAQPRRGAAGASWCGHRRRTIPTPHVHRRGRRRRPGRALRLRPGLGDLRRGGGSPELTAR